MTDAPADEHLHADAPAPETPTRRLRVLHLVVQPVLFWDDGDDAEPGPPLDPITVPLKRLPQLLESLPKEVAALEARFQSASRSGERTITA